MNTALATYLNDHLAGSVVAIRLLHALEEHFTKVAETRAVAQQVAHVRLEIEGERSLLESLIAACGHHESELRKAAGWMAERFTRLKLSADDDGGGAFQSFEMAELIALGILGKRGLWKVLQARSPSTEALQSIDFEALLTQSEYQYETIERIRLYTSMLAFESRDAIR